MEEKLGRKKVLMWTTKKKERPVRCSDKSKKPELRLGRGKFTSWTRTREALRESHKGGKKKKSGSKNQIEKKTNIGVG